MHFVTAYQQSLKDQFWKCTGAFKLSVYNRMSSVLRSYKNVQPTTVYNNGQVGDIKMSAAVIDHGGWLLCDGRALDVREYYMLFKMIGYSFGSADAGNKFLLPAPEGRVPGFIGQGPSGSPWIMGDASGAYTHTLTVAQMPSHNHSGLVDVSGLHTHGVTDAGHSHTSNAIGGSIGLITSDGSNTAGAGLDSTAGEPNLYTSPQALTIDTNTTGISIDSAGSHQHVIPSQGGDQPHNNIQPTLFVGNMFIYTGVNKYYAANAYP